MHVGTFMEAYFGDADLERIALSRRFALDVLCGKAEVHCPGDDGQVCDAWHQCLQLFAARLSLPPGLPSEHTALPWACSPLTCVQT